MATFVSSTLTKRTGSTTTTFDPRVKDGNVGYLSPSGSYADVAARLSMSSVRKSNRRITSFRIAIPQISVDSLGNPVVLRNAYADLTLTVPDGYAANDINDIVGYLHDITDSSKTNFNDLLVNGVGVY